MLGVWIEPVTAQVMTTLRLAMGVGSRSGAGGGGGKSAG
jgi:hypothetical protein